jgi:hypothetical protein
MLHHLLPGQQERPLKNRYKTVGEAASSWADVWMSWCLLSAEEQELACRVDLPGTQGCAIRISSFSAEKTENKSPRTWLRSSRWVFGK